MIFGIDFRNGVVFFEIEASILLYVNVISDVDLLWVERVEGIYEIF